MFIKCNLQAYFKKNTIEINNGDETVMTDIRFDYNDFVMIC